MGTRDATASAEGLAATGCGRSGVSLRTALRPILIGLSASLLLFAWPLSAAARPSVPRAFLGVVPQGPLGEGDYERMRGVVGTLRIPLYWYEIEFRPGEYDFGPVDEVVGQAAEHGIQVLPFVYGSPSWATGGEAAPPLQAKARASWTAFLRRLVQRYGPGGDFWRGRTKQLPIRRWQVWNEPNFLLFWRPRPSPVDYARLLRLSARAIRGADRRATIVAAGVAPVEAGIPPWTFLRRMYEVRGVQRDFDVAALHPYAPHVRWVDQQIRLVREVMSSAGDARKPLQLTEIGVASAGRFPNPFDKGRAGQASFLRRVFQLAIENRGRWRLAGVDWFTWQDATSADPHCVFCEYGGMLDANGMPKPSWAAFRAFVTGAKTQALR